MSEHEKIKLTLQKIIQLMILPGFLIIPCLVRSQSDWSPLNREVEVIYKDSTVRAYILINAVHINTSDQIMYYWYGQDSINCNKGGYAGALLDGPYSVYSNNKKLITQGKFEKGLMTGTWKYWYANGSLKKTIDYRKGMISGFYKIYSMDGSLMINKKFRNDKEVVSGKRKGEKPTGEKIEEIKKEKTKKIRTKEEKSGGSIIPPESKKE